MTKRKLAISGGPGTYQVRLDGIDVANAIRNLTLKLGVDHDLPGVTLDLVVWSIEDAELAAVPRIPDATSELLIALGWTPPEAVGKVRNLRDVQGQNGTWNVSGYMRGLYNGLELALSILEGERDPEYKDAPADGYLCDRPTPDMSGPEFEPVSDDAAGTPPAGDR